MPHAEILEGGWEDLRCGWYRARAHLDIHVPTRRTRLASFNHDHSVLITRLAHHPVEYCFYSGV